MSQLRATGRWRLPICVGTGLAISLMHQQPHRYSFVSGLTQSNPGGYTSRATRPPLYAPDPDFIKDISQGSMCGFGAGLAVGVFSQALTLMAGLTMFALHILQQWGLVVPGLQRASARLRNAILAKPLSNAVFRLSFAATFTLAAFVRI